MSLYTLYLPVSVEKFRLISLLSKQYLELRFVGYIRSGSGPRNSEFELYRIETEFHTQVYVNN